MKHITTNRIQSKQFYFLTNQLHLNGYSRLYFIDGNLDTVNVKTHQTFTCSKSTMETLGKRVKYVRSQQKNAVTTFFSFLFSNLLIELTLEVKLCWNKMKKDPDLNTRFFYKKNFYEKSLKNPKILLS